MTHSPEAYVFEARIADLRPTQGAVGYAEVERKRADWARLSGRDREDLLQRHVVPVVLGPGGLPYPVDHHHEARALLLEGRKTVLAHAIADLSGLKRAEFWLEMTACGWCWLRDAGGKPIGYADLPGSIDELADDPYRSLAGELREAGGYAKSAAPFAEFRWAEFLRRRVDDPADLKAALRAAARRDASHLPGWVRPRG
jgi:hypothetical protein